MDTLEIKTLFGKNVKYFRFHRRLSQSELAEKADISVTFLSNIERGKMFPKVETLSRLTESLGVDVSELFKPDIIGEDNKKVISRLSEDLANRVNTALEDVFKEYLG
jgi:transcriptional regulator with XRE-family HTH domain